MSDLFSDDMTADQLEPLAMAFHNIADQFPVCIRSKNKGGIRVEGNRVILRMGGGCQGCGQAAATLKFGVEQAIRASVPEVGDIIDGTDHAAGSNPYYAK